MRTFTSTATAFAAMVTAAVSYTEAAEYIRAARVAGTLDDDAARAQALAALLAKNPAYKAQLTEQGKPAQSSALQKAQGRLMRDTSPSKGDNAAQNSKAEAVELDIPADIMAAAMKLAKLCAEYEGAVKLAATALAKARASL